MSNREKRTRILAKSLFRELAVQGYEMHHVLALVNALIDEALTGPGDEAVPATAAEAHA